MLEGLPSYLPSPLSRTRVDCNNAFTQYQQSFGRFTVGAFDYIHEQVLCMSTAQDKRIPQHIVLDLFRVAERERLFPWKTLGLIMAALT